MGFWQMSRPLTATSVLETTGAFDKNPNRKRGSEPTPPDGEPDKPKLLKGREMRDASRIWDQYAPICKGMGTLGRGDEGEFATWCVLQAEFEKDPVGFTEIASRVGQKAAAATRFGIAGAGSRAKIGAIGNEKPQDPADKYLNVTNGPGNSLRQ
jgi:hypothetical protein